jgi:hypothetical protein
MMLGTNRERFLMVNSSVRKGERGESLTVVVGHAVLTLVELAWLGGQENASVRAMPIPVAILTDQSGRLVKALPSIAVVHRPVDKTVAAAKAA